MVKILNYQHTKGVKHILMMTKPWHSLTTYHRIHIKSSAIRNDISAHWMNHTADIIFFTAKCNAQQVTLTKSVNPALKTDALLCIIASIGQVFCANNHLCRTLRYDGMNKTVIICNLFFYAHNIEIFRAGTCDSRFPTCNPLCHYKPERFGKECFRSLR